MKFCVYVRMYNDEPFIDFFIEYYFKLGFDKIFILNSSNNGYTNLNKHVIICKVSNDQPLKLLPNYIHLVESCSFCNWVLAVDTDEFLILNNKYNTIKDFVKDKLKMNSNINVFQFRWLMIEKIDNEVCNLKDIIKNYKKYSNHHIKSMTKISDMKSLTDHQPILKKKAVVFLENKCINKLSPNEHVITPNSYTESALIHLHTRSMDDLMLKTLMGKFYGKEIKSLKTFKHIIYNPVFLNTFKKTIGLKASLPFTHTNNFSNNTANISIDTFNIPNIQIDFVKKSFADSLLRNALNKHNINNNQYRIYIEQLIKKINEYYNIKV